MEDEDSYDESEDEYSDDSEDDSDDDEEDSDEDTRKSKKEPPLNEQEMDTNFTLLKDQMNKMIAADPENKVFKKCLEDSRSSLTHFKTFVVKHIERFLKQCWNICLTFFNNVSKHAHVQYLQRTVITLGHVTHALL